MLLLFPNKAQQKHPLMNMKSP